jgi:DNA-binding SARP family transcriptional activator/tetratricopeptide (TPR) repeat protein
MELRLLGPVEVSFDGRVQDVGPPQQRLVLAALAAEAGRLVSIEGLIDRVWDDPPEQPRRTVQVYVSRIRRLLKTAEVLGQAPVAVLRQSGGYRLDIDPERVDVHRFQRLIGEARDRDCPEAQRLVLLGQALELWHGRPLADLPGRWADRVRYGLQQQYLDVVEAWALARLHAGDAGAVLPRLGELVGEYPLVESLAAAYMRALYAAGRPAEALEYYADIRRRLAEELGTDPSTELQRLHRQVLSADPALDPPATTARPGSQLLPRQLPAPPHMFTGRIRELATLDPVQEASTVVISAIDGMAGVGKTALAVHVAHRVSGRYPDGQLFIDLHGYTRGVEPVGPGEALDRMLRALGVAGPQIPAGLDERAALYRTCLADRQMLIVLDNAATEAQVAPLLPGAPGCLVLITSRRRLAGLDQASILTLDTLPVPDAVTLFIRTVGEGGLSGQPPELLVELVELCGRLPMAIRIAAARMRSHPSWTLSYLVERMRDRQDRLGELETGQRSVTAALDMSYQDLNSDQQRMYRLLGLHPGADIDVYAAAALFDTTPWYAQRVLDGLLDAHLLHEPVAGRYRFHDLTRAHATRTALRDEPDHTLSAALDRLLDHCRHTASTAMGAAYPYEHDRRPQVPAAGTPSPDLRSPDSALEWLDTNLPNLLAVARYASERGNAEHVRHLSTTLHRHLRTRGRYHDAITIHELALSTARASGHQAGEMEALTGLGRLHLMQGRPTQATDHHQHALRIARSLGHRLGELDALSGLGLIHRMQGRFAPAADHYHQVLRIARALGDRLGELDALIGLGHIHRMQGRHTQATDHFEQALQIARAYGHPGELEALTGLGAIHRLHGRYAQATDQYQQMLRIARPIQCG